MSPLSSERETQFVTALLMCGSPPGRLADCLMFGEKRTVNHLNYTAFKKHKLSLIEHLVAADYFDVHHGTGRLTEKAAVWIGQFYQWVLAQQESHSV